MPRSKKTSLRLKPEMWISILSLLLSVVTMLLGLYLNYRGENFQKQLLELRNKADLANITLNYENGILTAQNLGPATAQNLRLVICLSSVGDQWKDSIDEVSDLKFSVINAAIESSIQERKGICQSDFTNDDASQVTVKSLPPQQSIELKINQSADIPLSNQLMTTNIYLQTSETNLISDGTTDSTALSPSLSAALEKYVAESEFEIVDIEISMACTNCNLDKRQFTLSSLTKNEINQIESFRLANDIKVHISTSNHYFLPEDTSQGLMKDFYFIVDYDNNGNIRIVKSAKFEFAMPTPIPTMTPSPSKVTLDNLRDGQRVPCQNIISGTYTSYASEDIWPIVFADGKYYPQDEDGKAAQKMSGKWQQIVRFGDCTNQSKNDLGKQFQLIIVTANRSANAAFEAYASHGHTTGQWPGMYELPVGTEEQIRIVVVRE